MTPIAPWQVWWADLDPTRGHEQAGHRPVLVVSSRFHLQLTRAAIVTVVPMTTRHRPQLVHHLAIEIPGKPTSYLLTEQLRTIAADRISGTAPLWELKDDQIGEVRRVLNRMIDL